MNQVILLQNFFLLEIPFVTKNTLVFTDFKVKFDKQFEIESRISLLQII